MKTRPAFLLFLFLLLTFCTGSASAHCQIPCGIYDDQVRADLIAEHAVTIEKSMNQIVELGSATPVDYNQLVRWVTNKEEHATKIQRIVSDYFLTQRIKPDAEKYTEKLKLLHGLLLSAMKCKQTTDPSNVEELRRQLKEFEVLYFGHSHRE